MQRSTEKIHFHKNYTFIRYVGLLIVLLAAVWGFRLTILEGFIEAWPRGFSGDFSAAMFSTLYWDGEGIMYGPIFVILKWIVTWQPHLFTVKFFAVANVFLALGAFMFCLRACQASVSVVLVSLAAWLCYWRLFYAFSVAANPEFFELFFLSWAYYAASRKSEYSEGVLVAAAGLTKLIPYVFVVPLALRRSVRALVGLMAFVVCIVLLVAIGQRMSPGDLLFQLALPYNGRTLSFRPSLESSQFVGLFEALARLLSRPGELVLSVRQLYVVWASIRLLRCFGGTRDRLALALTYAMFFAFVPVLSLAAHPHTFLFLLPIWITFIDLLGKDQSWSKTSVTFAVFTAVCYVITGFPQGLMVADRLFGSSLLQSYVAGEPMVANLLLLIVIWAYVVVRTRGAGGSVQATVVPV